MAEYKAKEGVEDRNGEMTGAISINMVITMLPLTIWCFVISPMLIETVWIRAVVAVVLAIALPLACFRLSRWIWAQISHFMDGDDFNQQG